MDKYEYSDKIWSFYDYLRDRSGLWQKKKYLKKAPFQGKKSTFLAKKAPISLKKKKEHFWSRKKALSKHYFINKKQRESTYN